MVVVVCRFFRREIGVKRERTSTTNDGERNGEAKNSTTVRGMMIFKHFHFEPDQTFPEVTCTTFDWLLATKMMILMTGFVATKVLRYHQPTKRSRRLFLILDECDAFVWNNLQLHR